MFILDRAYLEPIKFPTNITLMNLSVVITEDSDDGGFIVSCPAIPGCHSEGETIDEALEYIRDAVYGCLAVLNERAQKGQGTKVVEITV
jgi:predicted RNase H-like HicB family nuclease